MVRFGSSKSPSSLAKTAMEDHRTAVCRPMRVVRIQLVGIVFVYVLYAWIFANDEVVDGLLTGIDGIHERMQQLSQSIAPEDCPGLLQRVGTGQAFDPLSQDGRKYQRQTNTTPPFWISVHSRAFDRTRWVIYEKGVYYEKRLEAIWRYLVADVHRNALDHHVLDIGGNIGYYSLLTASIGKNVHVHAFEPNLQNRIRFCESIHLNGWDATRRRHSPPSPTTPAVDIYPLGASDHSGVLTFYQIHNPGAGSFVKHLEGKNKPKYTTIDVPVVTLDQFAETMGWLSDTHRPNAVDPVISVLKIDVERYEAYVLRGARRLIQRRIVRNVFTETSREAILHNEQLQRESLHMMVEAGYKLVGQGGFLGPSQKVVWEQGPTLVDNILDSLNSNKVKYYNLWWTIDDVRLEDAIA